MHACGGSAMRRRECATSVAAAPALLLGHTVDAARLRDVAQAAASEIEPESDLHASAEFRRHLSTVLIQRAVRQATERATA